MANIRFSDDSEIFEINNPEEVSCLYFPLASETGLKSSITPDLGGDCKLDQEPRTCAPAAAPETSGA